MILCVLQSPDVKALTQTPLIWQGERCRCCHSCQSSGAFWLHPNPPFFHLSQLERREGQHWHHEHRCTAPEFHFSKYGKSKDGAAGLILSEWQADLTADYLHLCLQLQEDQSLNCCSGPSRAVFFCPETSFLSSIFTLQQQTQLVCKIPSVEHMLGSKTVPWTAACQLLGRSCRRDHPFHLASFLFPDSTTILHYWSTPGIWVRWLFDNSCALSLILHWWNSSTEDEWKELRFPNSLFISYHFPCETSYQENIWFLFISGFQIDAKKENV